MQTSPPIDQTFYCKHSLHFLSPFFSSLLLLPSICDSSSWTYMENTPNYPFQFVLHKCRGITVARDTVCSNDAKSKSIGTIVAATLVPWGKLAKTGYIETYGNEYLLLNSILEIAASKVITYWTRSEHPNEYHEPNSLNTSYHFHIMFSRKPNS